jgi:hypothetical protein
VWDEQVPRQLRLPLFSEEEAEIPGLVDAAIRGLKLPEQEREHAIRLGQFAGKEWLLDWLRNLPVSWEAVLRL